jgi:hypothetical protein
VQPWFPLHLWRIGGATEILRSQKRNLSTFMLCCVSFMDWK